MTEILNVSRIEQTVGGRKGADGTVLIKEDLGWSILLKGSYERLLVGYDEPVLKPGDRVKITIQKAD